MEIRITGTSNEIEKLLNAITGSKEQFQSANSEKVKRNIKYLKGYHFNHPSSKCDDNHDK